MTCIPHIFIIFISTTLWSTAPQSSALQFPINVWPKPTSIKWPHPQAIRLSPKFTISSPRHRYLIRAARRYRRLVLSEHHRPLVPPLLNLTSSPPLQTLAITVSDVAAPLSHGVDESYTLEIPSTGAAAELAAVTAWGAMRGMETFSQLVYSNPAAAACGLRISDAPLFAHRGVLLDTSRNYYKAADLVRLVRAMSMNKLNVFHWHITDSHSFPLVVPSEAELAERGAYGEEMKYTAADVKKIVEHGMEHGVRVVPEIDMPAHTGSWGEAYPEIMSCANEFWWPAEAEWADRLASEPATGQLNPLNPKTYQVVKNVISDVVAMFPDQFYHAGADEVAPNCWKTDPHIQDFLSNNQTTLSHVLEIFVNSTLPYILSKNRTVVYWEDVLLDDTVRVSPSSLPPEHVVLQSWNNGPNNTKRIVSAGYRAIVSSADYYYLDCGHGGFLGNDSEYDKPPGADQGSGGSWCAPFKTWQTIYNYDITYGLKEAEAKMVLGGEVALWSEQADSTVMDSRIWPRASAMAEALWSGNRDEMGKKRSGEAVDRLSEWRYRMVGRGIGAEPIQPLWCIKNPGMCNTVHDT
ncbi:beta-hexosaminidase 2-like [Salvia miltiorrhiza]|uniref:beta-hexosaminidase 2-like n=1 Tax=Salvia miltiorrhiza TaxID=226208 RepID=UPI0025AB90EF|nr:beta-hexosaminidase 2-like [Salvia miltiorrhiza]